MIRLLTYLDRRIFGDTFYHIIDQKILEPEELPADIVRLELYSIEHIWQEVKQRFYQIEDAKKQIVSRTQALITLIILTFTLVINDLIPDSVQDKFTQAISLNVQIAALILVSYVVFIVGIRNFHPVFGINITRYPDSQHITALIGEKEGDVAETFQQKQVLIQVIKAYRAANAKNAKMLLSSCKFLAVLLGFSTLPFFGVIYYLQL